MQKCKNVNHKIERSFFKILNSIRPKTISTFASKCLPL